MVVVAPLVAAAAAVAVIVDAVAATAPTTEAMVVALNKTPTTSANSMARRPYRPPMLQTVRCLVHRASQKRSASTASTTSYGVIQTSTLTLRSASTASTTSYDVIQTSTLTLVPQITSRGN